MTQFLRLLYIGLGEGSIYAMLGLGLVVIYRATGLLNFAQGEMAMASTFFVSPFHSWGLPIALALLAGVVTGFVFGALVHQVVVRPLGNPRDKPLAMLIVTLGLYLGLDAGVRLIWGSDGRILPELFGAGTVSILGAPVSWQRLGALLVLAFEVVIFWLLFKKTKIGLAMRAVASNAESSELVGIPISRVLMVGWGLSAALGAVAGTFTAPGQGLDANLMVLPLVYAFAAITLGGFDSLVGAVVGGLMIGVVKDVVPNYLHFFGGLELGPVFLLILLILLVRPQGLFGRRSATRV